MAKQVMPRSGSVRHPPGRPGHGLRGSRSGSPKPAPRPGTGTKGMTPAGAFSSRPNAGRTNPTPVRGSNRASGPASRFNFGRAGKGRTNPRPGGQQASPVFGGRY